MEKTCHIAAYKLYVETASAYSVPLTYEQWLKNLDNQIVDVMAGC